MELVWKNDGRCIDEGSTLLMTHTPPNAISPAAITLGSSGGLWLPATPSLNADAGNALDRRHKKHQPLTINQTRKIPRTSPPAIILHRQKNSPPSVPKYRASNHRLTLRS